MSTKKLQRIAWIGAGAALLLLLLLGVLLTVDWDSPRLGAAVLGRAGGIAGLDLRAREFRLNLLRGLELEGVELRGDLEAGQVEATMDRLVLAHRLLPLLSGRVVVDELILDRPRISLLAADEAAASASSGSAAAAVPAGQDPPPAAEEAGGGLAVHLSSIEVRGGSLQVRYEGEPAPLVDLQELDLELHDLELDPDAPSVLQGLSAEGEVEAGETVLEPLRSPELAGKIRLADGHLQLYDLEMPANLGLFRVEELDVDLTPDPIRFALSVTGDPLHTGELIGAASKVLGRTRLSFTTTGELGETFGLDGQGTLSFEAGRLPQSPVLAAVDELLPEIDVVGEAYEPFEIHFRLSGEQILAELFELATGDLRFAVDGAVGLDQSIQMHWMTKVVREKLAESDIPPEVLEALTGADGLVHLPILVTGSRSAPKARFDRSRWTAAAQERLRQEATRELQEQGVRALGKLLGGGEEADQR